MNTRRTFYLIGLMIVALLVASCAQPIALPPAHSTVTAQLTASAATIAATEASIATLEAGKTATPAKPTVTPVPPAEPTATSTAPPTTHPASAKDSAVTPLAWGQPCPCSPGIEFTYVPPYASFDSLQGRVWCVEPTDYSVAVYIYVSGWWTKPYWAWPLTSIQPDGVWICDITTGGTDQLAIRIAAFLLPNGYDPPLMSGGQTLPPELFERAVAYVIVDREPVFRQIEFSGYTWNVKASETPAGPGPNYFSDRPEDVWVDEQGQLHLRIVPRNGRWYCTEVFTEAPLGHGNYIFDTGSRVDLLDPNVVLGLFTWDDTAPEYNYREMDIEFSRWGQADNDNAQYVVQPWYREGNMVRFNVELSGDQSTHCLDWRADQVFFQSLHGQQPCPGPIEEEIASWTYTGEDIPPAGAGNARINLWLMDGTPPTDGEPVEVIIEAFEFLPVVSR